MDAIDFLIQRRILTDRDLDKKFPLNLSRDCHINSAKEIVQAMDDYHKHKMEEIESQTENIAHVNWNPPATIRIPDGSGGGYTFPNKEAADAFIEYCKDKNVGYKL